MIGEVSSAFRPLLAPGVTRDYVARSARDAALAFCRGASSGSSEPWTRRELAEWLTGPYQAVAGLVDHVIAHALDSMPPSTLSSPRAAHAPTNETIASLLEPAARSAMACVEALACGDAATREQHLHAAIERGSLVEAITLRGEVLLVPLHRPRMRLARRVCSLFLADFALRPDDYAACGGVLQHCAACGVVLLGPGALDLGLCGLHARRSGFVTRMPGVADVSEDELSVDVDLSDLGT